MKKTFQFIAMLLMVLTLVILAFSPTPVLAATSAMSPPQGMTVSAPRMITSSCVMMLTFPTRSCITYARVMATPAAQPAKTVVVALTPEMLIGFASVILALLFDWLPGLKTWYEKFSDGQKRGLMTGLLVIVTGAVFGLSCAGWLQTGWLCNGTGIQDAVYLLILAVAINQGIHSLTKP